MLNDMRNAEAVFGCLQGIWRGFSGLLAGRRGDGGGNAIPLRREVSGRANPCLPIKGAHMKALDFAAEHRAGTRRLDGNVRFDGRKP